MNEGGAENLMNLAAKRHKYGRKEKTLSSIIRTPPFPSRKLACERKSSASGLPTTSHVSLRRNRADSENPRGVQRSSRRALQKAQKNTVKHGGKELRPPWERWAPARLIVFLSSRAGAQRSQVVGFPVVRSPPSPLSPGFFTSWLLLHRSALSMLSRFPT